MGRDGWGRVGYDGRGGVGWVGGYWVMIGVG